MHFQTRAAVEVRLLSRPIVEASGRVKVVKLNGVLVAREHTQGKPR